MVIIVRLADAAYVENGGRCLGCSEDHAVDEQGTGAMPAGKLGVSPPGHDPRVSKGTSSKPGRSHGLVPVGI